MQESNLTFRQACALVRHRVRKRLATYKGQDIWNTSFFIERLDLAVEAYDYQTARRPDGTTVKIDDLIEVVKEEFVDFVLIEDIEGHVRISDTKREITCEVCSASYDPLGHSKCPICEHPNLYQVTEHELHTLAELLNLAGDDPLARRALAQTEWWRLETSYLRIVTCFETFHKKLNELALAEAGSMTTKLPRLNLFQSIRDTQNWFQQHHNLDLFSELSPKEICLLDLVFNKRHVIVHNGGVMDEKYIEKTNGDHRDIGKPVPLSKEEVMKAIDVMRRVVQTAKAAFSHS